MLLQSLNCCFFNILKVELAKSPFRMVRLQPHLKNFTVSHLGNDVVEGNYFFENKFGPSKEKLFALKGQLDTN